MLGIRECGLDAPSYEMRRGVELTLHGRDVLGVGLEGPRRHATYIIGTLQQIDVGRCVPQTLVLRATVDRCQHTCKLAVDIGEHLKVKFYTCIGGTSSREDVKMLQEGQQFILGTPGRVVDLIGN